MLRQIINKAAGFSRCPVRRAARLFSSDLHPDIEDHIEEAEKEYTRPYSEKFVNQVTLLGRTGNDPHFMTTEKGTELALFSLAVNNRNSEKPTWLRIVCGTQITRIGARNVKKGDRVFVTGKILSLRENAKDISILSEEVIRVGRPMRRDETASSEASD